MLVQSIEMSLRCGKTCHWSFTVIVNNIGLYKENNRNMYVEFDLYFFLICSVNYFLIVYLCVDRPLIGHSKLTVSTGKVCIYRKKNMYSKHVIYHICVFYICLKQSRPIDVMDNDPRDRCIYLLTLYTGYRPHSGTSSTVTVTLQGNIFSHFGRGGQNCFYTICFC